MGDYLQVQFNNKKNCFCQVTSKLLHGKLRQRIDDLVCIKLTTSSLSCYVTASQVISGSESKLDISGLYGNKLNLSEGSKVLAEIVENPVNGLRAAIEPLCIDDWEILELNAEYIQSELLNQVRVIWPKLVLPIWVSGNICIFVKVGLTEPKGSAYIQLDQLTELIVSPKDRQRLPTWKQAESVSSSSAPGDPETSAPGVKKGGDISKHAQHSSVGSSTDSTNSQSSPDEISSQDRSNNVLYGMIKKWFPFLTPDSSPTEPSLTPALSADTEAVRRQWDVGEITTVTGRVWSFQRHELKNWWARYPSVCIVNKAMVPKAKSAAFLADLTLLLSVMEVEAEAKRAAKFRRKNQRNSRPVKTERHVGVVCVVVRDSSSTCPFVPPGHILLDEMFCKLHRIKVTSKVQLEKVTCRPSAVDRVQIQPTHHLPEFMNKESVLVAFKNYLRVVFSTHCYPLGLLSANTINIQIAADQYADFLVLVDAKKPVAPPSGNSEEDKDEDTPPVPPYFCLCEEDLANVALVCEEEITQRCNVSLLPEAMVSPDIPALKPVGCPELSQRLINFIQASLQGRSEGAYLLCGSRGTGKTTLVTSALHHMARHRHCFTYKLESSQLRGKAFDTIRRLLDSVIEECAWRQPSILFIDDLHSLCKAPAGPEEEVSAEILYSAKVSEVLRDRLCTMWRKRDRIAVVVTSLSRDSLHCKLTATHGVHLFHVTEEIPSLDQTMRCAMLKSVMNNLEINVIPTNKQLLSLSDKLEGYVARDLVAVVKRASHAHTIMSGGQPSAVVTADDIEAALEGFTPASLRGVTLHSPGESTWKDVGGLHNIKDQLVRMLEWPVKYRKLYAQCPIRLQSGVLLYGAPGTGKTLVAAVVAKEMGLNFISIKGPELLNKYIGASEQGVRDTFSRAQDVRPCVLFFDEFESLAPRRGHDSTGVTDRVVNQLLTQLDGVETLEGVYVLAATSRPDLIDPALLRPGRLDKSLCCGIPTREDRVEILEALARHMYIGADVDLKKVAVKCENCTGADLKSLLVNAQLEAVHDLMNKSTLHQDSGHLSEAADDEGEPMTGIYMSAMDGEVQPITPQLHCYQQVKRLYSQNAGHIPKRRSTKSFVDTVVTIQKSHIASALSTLQPSVSEAERLRYQQIYEHFTSSKTDRAIVPDQLTTAMQRVSLA